MRAIVCNSFGPPENLALETLADPQVKAGEVLVEIRAAAVNFPDVLIIQNQYQFKPDLPFIPGSEFAGVVREVAPDVTTLQPGDRVAAFVGNGAFAERIALPATACTSLPDDLDFEIAAAFTLTYGTSYHALLDRAALRAGETLLVLGAAGGVGLAAIEIGRAAGATVIAAASSAEKLAVCQEHGAQHLINYTQQDLREELKRITGKHGPDVIYDPVGGPYTEPAFRSIAWRGRYLVVGFAHGEIPKLPLNLALLKGASVLGVFWGDYVRREPVHHAQDLAQLLAWLAEGRLRPHISGRYPLADTAAALRDMAARRATGKLLITL